MKQRGTLFKDKLAPDQFLDSNNCFTCFIF